MNIHSEITKLLKSRKAIALCTIVATRGSSPRKVGSKMLVFADGSIRGTIGGGNLEKVVIQNAVKQLESSAAKLYNHDLLHQHNMCCGGTVSIFIEPILQMKKLYIFGAGHTGAALAKIAHTVGYETFVFDNREDYINDLPNIAASKLCVPYNKVLPTLSFDEDTFVVILTHDHAMDRDILSYCINQSVAYIGMIGSQRKVEMTKKMFVDANIATEELLAKVDMPIGLAIDAETPEEIAISILANLITVKNRH